MDESTKAGDKMKISAGSFAGKPYITSYSVQISDVTLQLKK